MIEKEEDEFFGFLPDEAPQEVADAVFRIWDKAVLENKTRDQTRKDIRKYLLEVYGETLVIDDFEVSEYGALTIRWSYSPEKRP